MTPRQRTLLRGMAIACMVINGIYVLAGSVDSITGVLLGMVIYFNVKK